MFTGMSNIIALVVLTIFTALTLIGDRVGILSALLALIVTNTMALDFITFGCSDLRLSPLI